MSELLAALSIDIARDASIGPGARREVVVGMLGVILIAGLRIKVPEWSGLNPQRATLTTSAILFALFVAMVIRFRRVIGKNWFHRGMMMYGVIVAVWMLALRGVAVLIGLSLSQIMTLDLLAIAVITTLTAVTVQTKLWVLIPIASVSTVIAALCPDSAQILMPLVLQLGYALSAFLWYRAAITPRQRRPQEAK